MTYTIDTTVDLYGNTLKNAVIEGYYDSETIDAQQDAQDARMDSIEQRLDNIRTTQFKVVDELPETGEAGYIYLVPGAKRKSKNAKDEYIWSEGEWELIGSTTFEFDLVQDSDGITINDVALQDASATQDGLMTKALVQEFRAKQDTLVAGANISIEGNVISATGGSGSGGGHASKVATFGGDGNTEYTVFHGLKTYNLIFQVRTVTAPIRYVSADIVAVDENNITVTLAKASDEKLSISILACDTSGGGGETSFDVDTKTYDTATTVWTYSNTSGDAVFVQLFDSDGNEIRGDIVEESADDYTPVVATLDQAYAGTMVIGEATKTFRFSNLTEYAIDLTQEGLSTDDRYLVQVYTDGTGMMMPDIIQDPGAGVISIDLGDTPVSGTIVLKKATQVFEFTDATEVVCTHNLGRFVGAQVYLNGTGQAMADVVCSLNDVTVSANIAMTGYVAIC